MKPSNAEKIAILLLGLNEDAASSVFELLEEYEIKEISQSMANLGKVDSQIAESIISEFLHEMNDSLSFVGNMPNTERFLRKILDKDKVDSILEDIRGPIGRNIWDKLGNVNEQVLAGFLKNEYPQTAALILSKLDSTQSAKVLSMLAPEFGFEILKRMLSMNFIKREVMDKLEKTLRVEFISDIGKIQKKDNNQAIAEVFNNFDSATELKFMKMLEEYNIEAANKVKRLMFTFPDLVRVDPRGLQVLIRSIDRSLLPTALKGASSELRELFMSGMSQRAAKLLVEEIENLGPIRLKNAEEAQISILNVAKDLIAKGDITVLSNDQESEEMIY